jgi:transitional endoplasmic reticulum ATPase
MYFLLCYISLYITSQLKSYPVRNLFQRARAASPSVIFLDEIDTIVGKRALDGGGLSSSSSSSTPRDSVQERVLSTLLNEMDGIEHAKGVLVVAATNRPDMVDAALLRPGRFDKVVHVAHPDASARLEILRIHTRRMRVSDQVLLEGVAERTALYTGADLESVCREAALHALRRCLEAGCVVRGVSFLCPIKFFRFNRNLSIWNML